MRILDIFEELGICLSLIIMVIINFGNVFSRYIIHASWSFSEEVMVTLFVYITFFGASIAFKRGSHLNFSVLIDLLPSKLKKILIIVIHLFSAGLLIIFVKYGVGMVFSEIVHHQTTPALGWPAWVQTLSVPLGSLLIIIRIIQSCRRELKNIEV